MSHKPVFQFSEYFQRWLEPLSNSPYISLCLQAFCCAFPGSFLVSWLTLRAVIHWELNLAERQFHSLMCENPGFQASFEGVCFPMCVSEIPVKNQMTVAVWTYFRVLVCLSICLAIQYHTVLLLCLCNIVRILQAWMQLKNRSWGNHSCGPHRTLYSISAQTLWSPGAFNKVSWSLEQSCYQFMLWKTKRHIILIRFVGKLGDGAMLSFTWWPWGLV